jgi:hypothetical protein
MQILIPLIGSALIAFFVTRHFSKKSDKHTIDLSGFIIQEITKNPNYVYPVIGEDEKLHKAVEAKTKISRKANISCTVVKKE